MAIWLAMVPDGTKTAAGLPRRAAKASSKRAHRGVLPVVVVPHHRLRHGAPHGGCRLGDGVAAKVDQIGHAATLTTRR